MIIFSPSVHHLKKLGSMACQLIKAYVRNKDIITALVALFYIYFITGTKILPIVIAKTVPSSMFFSCQISLQYCWQGSPPLLCYHLEQFSPRWFPGMRCFRPRQHFSSKMVRWRDTRQYWADSLIGGERLQKLSTLMSFYYGNITPVITLPGQTRIYSFHHRIK